MCFENIFADDQIRHRFKTRRHLLIPIKKIDAFTNFAVSDARPLPHAGHTVFPQIDGLGRAHQFNAQNLGHVPDDLHEVPGAVGSHGDMILLIGAGGD